MTSVAAATGTPPAAASWSHDVVRQYLAVAVGLVCLAVAIAVSAQEAGGGQPGTGDISIDDSVQQAKAHIDAMHRKQANVFKLVEEARSGPDVNRLQCLNGHALRIQQIVKLADGYRSSLEKCAAQSDGTCVSHELVKISISASQVEEAEGQLVSCGNAGDNDDVDGKPYIQKTFEGAVPEVDPTDGLKNVPVQLENPPPSSPFFAQN